MNKLADFFQGETKNWRATFEDDLSNSTLYFRMAKKLDQAAPDLEVMATLDSPIDEGLPTQRILGCSFSISNAASEALEPGEYYGEHEIRSLNRVDLFLRQRITVMLRVPKSV